MIYHQSVFKEYHRWKSLFPFSIHPNPSSHDKVVDCPWKNNVRTYICRTLELKYWNVALEQRVLIHGIFMVFIGPIICHIWLTVKCERTDWSDFSDLLKFSQGLVIEVSFFSHKIYKNLCL